MAKIYKCPNMYCKWEGDKLMKDIRWGLEHEIKHVLCCPECGEVVKEDD